MCQRFCSPLFLFVGALLALLHFLWRQSNILLFILFQASLCPCEPFVLVSPFCVLVNPLWPQHLPCRISAKCWPPPWHCCGRGCLARASLGCLRPLWPWVLLDIRQIPWAVHHLGQDGIPCQDVHVERNVWERISGFQTLLGAQQSLHTTKNHET